MANEVIDGVRHGWPLFELGFLCSEIGRILGHHSSDTLVEAICAVGLDLQGDPYVFTEVVGDLVHDLLQLMNTPNRVEIKLGIEEPLPRR